MPAETDRESITAPRQLQPVFIIGQYKCGTSWLDRILSAHPAVMGVAEVDLIGASYNIKPGAVEPASSAERLQRLFRSSWCNRYTPAGWQYTDVVERFERGEPVPTQPWNRSQPRKFMHLSAETARALYEQIKAAATPAAAMDAFVAAACTDAREESHVVLKAADQISKLDILKSWQPCAKKIVITRDGRDASISAQHYEDLMTEVKPWHRVPFGSGYWDLLRMWANRADKAIAAAAAGDVYVLRYEDLTVNFVETTRRLLQWLGLDDSESLINSIQQETSFERMTGRPRGTEGKGIVRKGAIGEWRSALEASEQERSWRVAGEQLTALGYTRDGTLLPLPDLTQATEFPYRLERTLQLEQELDTLRATVDTLRAKVGKFKSQARAQKEVAQHSWANSVRSTLQAARAWTKHLARLLLSVATLFMPTLDNALWINDWIDSVIV